MTGHEEMRDIISFSLALPNFQCARVASRNEDAASGVFLQPMLVHDARCLHPSDGAFFAFVLMGEQTARRSCFLGSGA